MVFRQMNTLLSMVWKAHLWSRNSRLTSRLWEETSVFATLSTLQSTKRQKLGLGLSDPSRSSSSMRPQKRRILAMDDLIWAINHEIPLTMKSHLRYCRKEYKKISTISIWSNISCVRRDDCPVRGLMYLINCVRFHWIGRIKGFHGRRVFIRWTVENHRLPLKADYIS